MIKLKQLCELGEFSSKPYKYNITYMEEDELTAYFTNDDNIKFRVNVYEQPNKYYEIDFKPVTQSTFSGLTSSNDLLRIVSTVFQIVEKYYEKFKDIINGFILVGTLKPSEERAGELVWTSQRTRIYSTLIKRSSFVRKNFEISVVGNKITLSKKGE